MNITHQHVLSFSPNDLLAREQADITKATLQNAGIDVKEKEYTTAIILEWVEHLIVTRGEE